MMPLELLTPGERGEITEVKNSGICSATYNNNECGSHGHSLAQKATGTRTEEMGLRVGKMVEVLKNDGNLLLLLVDEARIAIDRKIARTIKVKGVTA
jgi:ferrous iron transport protein A